MHPLPDQLVARSGEVSTGRVVHGDVLDVGGRARVVADPGPRQYCVRQGWLVRPGEIAICAPNRVSIQIAGRTKAYDSLSY